MIADWFRLALKGLCFYARDVWRRRAALLPFLLLSAIVGIGVVKFFCPADASCETTFQEFSAEPRRAGFGVGIFAVASLLYFAISRLCGYSTRFLKEEETAVDVTDTNEAERLDGE